MPSYLVETYLPRDHAEERSVREQRARSAAEKLTSVRFDHAIHIPEDEICFYVFDAPAASHAELAAANAGLDPLRVVEAVPSRKEKK